MHAPPKDHHKSDGEISETNQNDDQNDCKIIDDDDNQGECKIIHVEEGDKLIKEMLTKQVNYGNKLKYTDGQAN